ncbi:MAG: hypothetical protein ISS53_00305 [Dehalococcoidia bacterium]|nr:hypothetical protein [Dehalococcoidia bacterium]
MTRKSVPPGNQNARRHGFYSEALTEAERLELAEAASIEGLDDEIAVLRLKLRQFLEDHPERIDLQLKLANTLARLIRTRYNITSEQKNTLKEAIATVLKDVAAPLGIKFIP